VKDIDEISKKRAFELFGSSELADFEIGTTRGLQQVHEYLFVGLYDFAGKIREVFMKGIEQSYYYEQ
jgi:cell filamentation protein